MDNRFQRRPSLTCRELGTIETGIHEPKCKRNPGKNDCTLI